MNAAHSPYPRDVSTCSGLPVLADADTGFGELEAIPRLVQEYSRAGAAGLHIEDQVRAYRERAGFLSEGSRRVLMVSRSCI